MKVYKTILYLDDVSSWVTYTGESLEEAKKHIVIGYDGTILEYQNTEEFRKEKKYKVVLGEYRG